LVWDCGRPCPAAGRARRSSGAGAAPGRHSDARTWARAGATRGTPSRVLPVPVHLQASRGGEVVTTADKIEALNAEFRGEATAICEGHATGTSIPTLAQEYGVSRQRIRHIRDKERLRAFEAAREPPRRTGTMRHERSPRERTRGFPRSRNRAAAHILPRGAIGHPRREPVSRPRSGPAGPRSRPARRWPARHRDRSAPPPRGGRRGSRRR